MNENKSFDARLKQKLTGISSQPPAGNWETFQKKWRESESVDNPITDSAFDSQVKSKLNTIDKNVKTAQWEKLKNRLETIDLYRRKIIIHKVKEVVAVLLFLFTFYNVFQHAEMDANPGDPLFVANDVLHDKPYSTTQNIRINQVQSTVIAKRKKGASQPAVRLHSEDQRVTGVISEEVISSDTDENILFANQDDSAKAGSTFTDETGESITSVGETENMDTPDILPLARGEVYSTYAMVLPMELQNRDRKTDEFRLGIFIAHAENFILTPYDKVYSVPQFENSTKNQSYGFTIGKKTGNVEMETGVAYAHLRYEPVKISEAFASAADVYFETSLTGITFDLFKIPLQVKYFALDKPGWKIYTMAGAALNVIGQAEYEIEENIVKGRPASPLRFNNESPRLVEKPFTKGIFDEGKLKENYFTDVQLGFGIEKNINRFMNMYVQTAYHAFLYSDNIGVGPNFDKLNSFQVQVGCKWVMP
jgi:hypothetical protein